MCEMHSSHIAHGSNSRVVRVDLAAAEYCYFHISPLLDHQYIVVLWWQKLYNNNMSPRNSPKLSEPIYQC
jgi:hypothetical protein